MWVITHVFAGLAIAAAVGGPWWLVLALVLLSHVVMDLVPHWDYSATRRPILYGFVDFGAGLVVWLVCWLVLGMPFWMALMGPVSGAPDWDVLIAELRGKPDVHYFPSHSQTRARPCGARVGRRRAGGDHDRRRRRGARPAAVLTTRRRG